MFVIKIWTSLTQTPWCVYNSESIDHLTTFMLDSKDSDFLVLPLEVSTVFIRKDQIAAYETIPVDDYEPSISKLKE